MNIEQTVDTQRKFFATSKTFNIKFRLEALDKLKASVKKHETDLLEAIHKDLGKSATESYMCEVGLLLEKITYTRKHLRSWERGIENDYRKEVYDAVKNFTLEDATKFFNEHIQGKTYDIMIVGPKEKVDFNLLKNYGDVKELTVDEVFNY